MTKTNFEKFILKNLPYINGIYCRIWEGYNIENKFVSWLEVYIDYENDYEILFCSENYSNTSKELLALQKKWIKKLNNWINPNWDIEFVSDVQGI